MSSRRGSTAKRLARALLAVFAAFLSGWMAWALVSWIRYGHDAGTLSGEEAIRYLPGYEVVELFESRVHAPASLTFAAARNTSLTSSPFMRGIFRAREILMGIDSSKPFPEGGVVDQMTAMGWTVLSLTPDREIILGTVTQPWRGNVVFRPLPPQEFVAFREPDFVKIVVVIAAVPIDDSTSVFRIETLVGTTDAMARARFRRYWSVFSPGILLIRELALHAVKRDAEAPTHFERRSPTSRRSRVRTRVAARSRRRVFA